MTADGTPTGHVFSQRSVLDSLDLAGYARSMGLGIGSTCAWNPELLSVFGPIKYPATFDDLIFCFRARLLDRIAFVPEPLVYYRYGESLSMSVSADLDIAREDLCKRSRRAIETYRQRRLDCQVGAPERGDLISSLETFIEAETIKLRIFEKQPFAILRACESFAAFAAALSALNTLRKIRSKRRRERNRLRNQGLET